MSNTTFDQAMEKAVWMTEQGIKIETSEWTQTWESLLHDSQVHPVLLGKAMEALESEYAGLKASVDESTWIWSTCWSLHRRPVRPPQRQPNHTRPFGASLVQSGQGEPI